MTLTITNGMKGKRIETVGKYCIKDLSAMHQESAFAVIDKMFNDFYEWKKKNAAKKYRVASYDRQLFSDKDHKIVIDFGDHSVFGLIKTNKKEWELLEKYMCKPVNLEV